jgi:hypothetical protein
MLRSVLCRAKPRKPETIHHEHRNGSAVPAVAYAYTTLMPSGQSFIKTQCSFANLKRRRCSGGFFCSPPPPGSRACMVGGARFASHCKIIKGEYPNTPDKRYVPLLLHVWSDGSQVSKYRSAHPLLMSLGNFGAYGKFHPLGQASLKKS